MATTSSKSGGTSTSTRKSSTSTKSAGTTTSGTDSTSGDQPPVDTDTAVPVSAEASGDPTVTDPAAALKAKMRTTQHVGDTRPDDLTDEQRENLLGAPAGALPGPRTLASPSAPTRKGEAYVTAASDGYVAFLPDRVKQPATVRVWVEGQRVRKDMHDALSSVVASSAMAARVLTGDEYTQVANYL